MSRSKRKPIHTDGYGSKTRKFMKRLSNKLIRQRNKTLTRLIPDGSKFKQLLNSWDICDWKFYEHDEDHKDEAKRK